MSYYYNYYIGYKKDDKFYPLGPFDGKGKLYEALSRSRSFASDLHESFRTIDKKDYSEELKEQFSYENYDGETQLDDVSYLPLNELPNDDFIKRGYFLLDDIKHYQENDGCTEGLFYEYISPELFAIKMNSELTFGPPTQKFDCEGAPFENYTCADYGYYAYPDYFSKEYESHVLKQFAAAYEFSKIVEGAEIVILETEG